MRSVSPKIVPFLQARYFDENVAENQYRAHAAILTRRGYAKGAAVLIEHADDEAKHKGMLAKRLAEFNESATPFGGKCDSDIGSESELEPMLAAELPLENRASVDYNAGIAMCVEAGDNTTRAMLEEILGDETDHVDDLERIQGNIDDIGIQNVLQQMMG